MTVSSPRLGVLEAWEWSDSGYILKGETAGLAAGLNIGGKQKRGVKDNPKVFGLNNWKHAISIL